MSFHLVVAHQTAASPELIAALQRIAGLDRTAEFILLVPETPTRQIFVWGEGDQTAIARERAEAAAATLRAAGIAIRDVVVGAPDPLKAIRQELGSGPWSYTQVVISTLPRGVSRWLGRDLPRLVRRELGVPVYHVVAHSTAGR